MAHLTDFEIFLCGFACCMYIFGFVKFIKLIKGNGGSNQPATKKN